MNRVYLSRSNVVRRDTITLLNLAIITIDEYYNIDISEERNIDLSSPGEYNSYTEDENVNIPVFTPEEEDILDADTEEDDEEYCDYQ